MAIKNDMVMSYIESLNVGTKVSVRGLSTALNVSEGTAYKAIKESEARGLVITRPKAGTFRIDSTITDVTHETTVMQISKILGLSVAAGTQFDDKIIQRLIVCDGDEDSLLESLDSENCADGILCIVGNRPEVQRVVIEAGAHLLVTGGSRPKENLIVSAEKNGICILTSLQSTYSLLRLFDNHLLGRSLSDNHSTAKDWMQIPNYLYYNDIAADWHRLYQSVSNIAYQYPVVDDDLKICGALDIGKAFASTPSQKVSGILTGPTDYLNLNASVPMLDIAERMVLTGKSLAAVSQDGKMCGLITANDLLRFFLYSGNSGSSYQYESFLEETEEEPSLEQRAFQIHFPEDEIKNFSEFALLIMLAAAKRHAEDIFKLPCVLDNGTFFATNSITSTENLMLSSVKSKSGQNQCAFEVELHDDTQSYNKSILMFSHA